MELELDEEEEVQDTNSEEDEAADESESESEEDGTRGASPGNGGGSVGISSLLSLVYLHRKRQQQRWQEVEANGDKDKQAGKEKYQEQEEQLVGVVTPRSSSSSHLRHHCETKRLQVAKRVEAALAQEVAQLSTLAMWRLAADPWFAARSVFCHPFFVSLCLSVSVSSPHSFLMRHS